MDSGPPVSRLADDIEAVQLGLTVELIDEARRLLTGRRWTSGEINLLAVELTEALTVMEEGQKIILSLKDEVSPGLLQTEEDRDFSYVIMPMRIL